MQKTRHWAAQFEKIPYGLYHSFSKSHVVCPLGNEDLEEDAKYSCGVCWL